MTILASPPVPADDPPVPLAPEAPCTDTLMLVQPLGTSQEYWPGVAQVVTTGTVVVVAGVMVVGASVWVVPGPVGMTPVACGVAVVGCVFFVVVVNGRVVLVLGRVVVGVGRLVVVLGRVVGFGAVVELACWVVVVAGRFVVTGHVVVPGWGLVGRTVVVTGRAVGVAKRAGRELVAIAPRVVAVVGSLGLVVTRPVVLAVGRVVLVDGRSPPVRNIEVVPPGPVDVGPFDPVVAVDEGLALGGTVLLLTASPSGVDVALYHDGSAAEVPVVVEPDLVVAGAVVGAASGYPAGVGGAKRFPGRP